MIVVPQPPVEVWFGNTPLQAVAYLNEWAVVTNGAGALYLRKQQDLSGTPPTSPGTDEADPVTGTRRIRRGDVVIYRDDRSSNPSKFRVTDVGRDYRKCQIVTNESVDGVQSLPYVEDVNKLALVPFQKDEQLTADAMAAYHEQAKEKSPFKRGSEVWWKGDKFVFMYSVGDKALIRHPLSAASKSWVKLTDLTSDDAFEPAPISPAPALVCPKHVLGEDDRCVTCGVSKKAIQAANEFYIYGNDRAVDVAATPNMTEPGWLQRVRQLSGELGVSVTVTVKDRDGVPILSENIPV